jgi:hypothetical protein
MLAQQADTVLRTAFHCRQCNQRMAQLVISATHESYIRSILRFNERLLCHACLVEHLRGRRTDPGTV